MLTTVVPKLGHVSHSTFNLHAGCAHAFQLRKGAQVPESPSVAAVAGKACHSVIEHWDREDCPEWSPEDWNREAVEFLEAAIAAEETATGIPSSTWRVSGRATKDRPNKEDLAWWRSVIGEMCAKWGAWRQANPRFQIWVTPDGEQAIELEIKIPVPGLDIPFLCYIDRILIDVDTSELIVLDIKSGARSPESLDQLTRYAMAIEARYGVRPAHGAYYSTRKGECVAVFKDGKTLMPLSHLPSQVIAADMSDRWALMQTGRYPASTGRHCDWCSVRSACVYAHGPQAWKYDPHHPGYKGPIQSQMDLAS